MITPAQTYRRLLRYLGRFRGAFALGLAGAILFAASNASVAVITKEFLDGTFLHRDRWILALVPVGLIGLFFVRGLGDFVQTYFMGHVGRGIIKQLRAEIFAHFLALPIAFYDRSAAGELLSRLTYNTEQVAQATTDSVTLMVRETLTIAGSFAVLF